MTTFTTFKTFEFKTDDKTVSELITLNNHPYINIVNVISASKLNKKWVYIVGQYNNVYSTNKMIERFIKNLNTLNIKYDSYYTLGIYDMPVPQQNATTQPLTPNQILANCIKLFIINDVQIISYNRITGSALAPVGTQVIPNPPPAPVPSSNPVPNFYEVTLLLHVDNICKAEKLLRDINITV